MLYLIGNWKMNPSSKREAVSLWRDIERTAPRGKGVYAVACPPTPYLALFRGTSVLALGAQDCFWEKEGAYTSGVSPAALKDLGCKYVIVGHSERREYIGETDEMIHKKVRAALKHNLRPILAVGEKTRKTFTGRGVHTNELDPIIEHQIIVALHGVSASQMRNVIIAYEPVWAISRGKKNHDTAEPDDVLMATLYIRAILAKRYSRQLAEHVPILYGGSTNSSNIEQFLTHGGVQGALVGSASIDASEFRRMGALIQAYARTQGS